jgi:phosphoesterase RecJ-like protein
MIDRHVLHDVAVVLKHARHVFVAAHIMPDGDCIGSQLALAHALRGMGKGVTLAVDDKIPEGLNFLAGVREISPHQPRHEDVFVYVDGSDSTRYGETLDREKIGARPVILIDHHITNEPFGDYNLVDTDAASTAEIVYTLIQALDVPLTPVLAQALLTGVVTDTLGFRTTSTTAETLATATQLVQRGGSIPEIIDHVYNRRSFNALHVLGYALEHATLDGKIIYSAIDYKTLREFGVNGNGTSGIVNHLLTVAEAKIAFFLVERKDGRGDLGLRSRAGVDISGVATRLGGGGHKQASGALLPPPFDTAAQRVLEAIRAEFK